MSPAGWVTISLDHLVEVGNGAARNALLGKPHLASLQDWAPIRCIDGMPLTIIGALNLTLCSRSQSRLSLTQ